MANLNISISAEPVFHLGSISITNSLVSSWVVSAILIAISIWAYKNVRFTKKPTGFQNVLEMIVDGLYNFAHGILESTPKIKAIFPFFFSFFVFIILNNWFGLIPGVGTIGFREEVAEHTVFVPLLRAGTSDLNTTLALALVSCFFTWVYGFKFLGVKGYLSKFKNPLEIVSEISRLISFTFRLFGNVFAGEVLLVVISSLVPIVVPSVFYGLEIFVGAIQALVFAMLTLCFMNLATESEGEEAHQVHA